MEAVLGAVAGTIVTALGAMWLDARKRRDEARQRHAAVYLTFLGVWRDVVETRSDHHRLESRLQELTQEAQQSKASLATAAELISEGREAKDERSKRLALKRVDEILPDKASAEQHVRELREASQEVEGQLRELGARIEERRRSAFSALDQLALVAAPPIMKPAELLVTAAGAFQDAPSDENRGMFDAAERLYLQAVRAETQ